MSSHRATQLRRATKPLPLLRRRPGPEGGGFRSRLAIYIGVRDAVMPSLNSAYSDSPRTKQEFSGMDASVEVSEPLRPAAEPEPEPAGGDASAIVVARADEKRAKEALEDGCCAGAAPFLLIAAVWCGLAAFGVVGLVADTGSSEPEPEPEPGAEEPDGLRIAGIASLAAAGLLLLYGLGPKLLGMCSDGPPPAPHGPFQGPRKEEDKVNVRKLMLFYNPVSGVDPAKNVERAEHVRSRLRAANIEVEVRTTPNPTAPPYDTTADVIRDLDAEGLDGIVIIGGDGSFGEAVNGMLARPKGQQHIPLAHIACGSANSVVTDTKAVADPYNNYDEAQREGDINTSVDAIMAGYAPFVDANKVVYGPDPSAPADYAYSINVVAWSQAQEMAALNIDGWRCLGEGRYLACAAWGLLKGREGAVRIVADGKEVARAASTIFLSHTQWYGTVRGAPNAYWDDGLFDMTFISAKRRGQVLRIFVRCTMPSLTFVQYCKQGMYVTRVSDIRRRSG